MTEKKNIATGYVGNALRSSAADHTTTFTDEVFDTERQKHQSEVNTDIESKIEKEAEARNLAINAEEQARSQNDQLLSQAIAAEQERAEAAEQAIVTKNEEQDQKLYELEEKTERIEASQVEDTKEEIVIEDDSGNIVCKINPDGADFKALSTNGIPVSLVGDSYTKEETDEKIGDIADIREKTSEVEKNTTEETEDFVKVTNNSGEDIVVLKGDGVELYGDVKVNGQSLIVNGEDNELSVKILTHNLVADDYENHLFNEPIEAGTLIKRAKFINTSYQITNVWLIDDKGVKDLNLTTISFPYITTKKYIGYAANKVGYLMLMLEEYFKETLYKKSIHIKDSDSIEDVVKKLFIAHRYTNIDVYFDKSIYVIDDSVIDYIAGYFSLSKSTVAFPLGRGCRYYLNGSTIIVNQTDRYKDGIEVSCFDNQNNAGGWELYNGTLINNNSKYCIHDETAGTDKKYINIINGIKMYARNGAQCAYGCGTGYNADIRFENCLFDSDNSQLSSSNMVFHGPATDLGGVDFSLSFVGCYFGDTTKLSVSPTYFEKNPTALNLWMSGSRHKGNIESYVLGMFTDKKIFNNVID